MTDTDLIVVGGGLAGTAAAALAADAGLRTLLLERSGTAGGRARTTAVDGGWALNMGPHALYETGGGAAILDELGVDRAGAPPVLDGLQLRLAGDDVPLPLTPWQLLRASWMSAGERLRFARALGSVLRPRPAGALADVSMGRWLDERVGHGDARAALEALWRLATYAADPAMSAGAALHQMRIGTLGGVTYVHGGWQRLVEGLADAATTRGATLRTGVAVRAIEPAGAHVVVDTPDGPVTAGGVVVAAGGPRPVAGLLGDHLDHGLRAHLSRLVPVRAAVLDVALSRLPDPTATYLLGGDVPLYAAVQSIAARVAPEGGAVVHLARYLGTEASDPAAHRAMLEGVLDDMQPGWRDVLAHARFLPELVVTHDAVHADAGGLAGRVPTEVADRVWLAGDWVGPRGLLADAALLSARDAVAAATAAGVGRRRPVGSLP